jgi:hypothetical protein
VQGLRGKVLLVAVVMQAETAAVAVEHLLLVLLQATLHRGELAVQVLHQAFLALQ